MELKFAAPMDPKNVEILEEWAMELRKPPLNWFQRFGRWLVSILERIGRDL
jgi:hypothetical protein